MTLTSDDAKRIKEACEAWQPLSPMPAVFLTAAQVALPQVPDLIEEVERLRADVELCGESLDAAMSQIEQMKAQAYGERKGAADITREVVAEHGRLLEMLAEARQQRDEEATRAEKAERERDAFKAALQETRDTMVRAWVAMGDERTPQNAGTAQRVAAVFEAHAASLAAERDEAREQFGDLQEDYTELELELQDVRQQRDALAAFITDASRRERAEAWDEGAGYVLCQYDSCEDDFLEDNPYRDTEGANTEGGRRHVGDLPIRSKQQMTELTSADLTARDDGGDDA